MRRINNSLISSFEERILKKIVPLIPEWISPDLLSYSGFAAMILSGILYYLYPSQNYFLLLINFLLVFHWFADGTDGKVAKYRKIARPGYGHFLDHGLDTFSLAILCLGISFSPGTMTNAWMILATVGLSAFAINFLEAGVTQIFSLSLSGVGGTDVRIGLVLMNFILYFIGNKSLNLFNFNFTYLDLFGIIAAVVGGVLLIREFIQTSKRLSKI